MWRASVDGTIVLSLINSLVVLDAAKVLCFSPRWLRALTNEPLGVGRADARRASADPLVTTVVVCTQRSRAR
jgi:hypothetical protein